MSYFVGVFKHQKGGVLQPHQNGSKPSSLVPNESASPVGPRGSKATLLWEMDGNGLFIVDLPTKMQIVHSFLYVYQCFPEGFPGFFVFTSPIHGIDGVSCPLNQSGWWFQPTSLKNDGLRQLG